MDNSTPIFVMGGCLIALGGFLIRRHVLTWRSQKSLLNMPLADRDYFRRQYRRRMQTSGLLTAIGAMMLAGGLLMNNAEKPLLLLAWLIGLLLLVLWVFLLALGDWLAIRAHTQAALTEVRTQQYVLEREANRLRDEVRSNGDGNGESEL